MEEVSNYLDFKKYLSKETFNERTNIIAKTNGTKRLLIHNVIQMKTT